ncbi:hypothetical protein ACLKA7_013796 [Drosophila subpalustris]
MGSYMLLGLSGLLLIGAVYGYNDKLYIRGDKGGSYTVPGVDGKFQYSPITGEHAYLDQQQNGFLHQGDVQAAGRQLPSENQANSYGNQPRGTNGANFESKDILITQPDGFIQFKGGQILLQRNRRDSRVLAGNLIVHGENVVNNGKDVKVMANSSGNKIIVDKFGNILTTSPHGKSFKFPAGN